MRRWQSATLLGLLSVALAWSTLPAAAQPPVRRRYVPRRPTMSPYLDYFRRDTGLLDPYNLFRKRNVRLNQAFEQQRRQLQYQQYQLNQTRLQFEQVQQAQRQMRASGATPTGHGSTFMNYSHYFGGSPAGGAAPVRSR